MPQQNDNLSTVSCIFLKQPVIAETKLSRNKTKMPQSKTYFPEFKDKHLKYVKASFNPYQLSKTHSIGESSYIQKFNHRNDQDLLKTRTYFNQKLDKEIAEMNTMTKIEDLQKKIKIKFSFPIKIKGNCDLFTKDLFWKRNANKNAIAEEERMYLLNRKLKDKELCLKKKGQTILKNLAMEGKIKQIQLEIEEERNKQRMNIMMAPENTGFKSVQEKWI